MKITWKIDPPIRLIMGDACSPSDTNFFSAIKVIIPTIVSKIGTEYNILSIFSRACELKKARTNAPKDSIAPGNLGNCVPPNADPIIKIAITIKIFSMNFILYTAKINQ